MRQGRFISFEGGEGTGKSTQARLLSESLVDRGVDVCLTREPGGTEGAEAIRKLLLDPPGEGWPMQAEAALFAAARADHVAGLIKPTLAQGEWVICDRFLDSSRAYQGGAGGLGDEAILTLHEICSMGILPDFTILIDVEADIIARRLQMRDQGRSDAIGGRDIAFHAEVKQTFHALARREPDRFVVIDGNASVEIVHERIMATILPLLESVE